MDSLTSYKKNITSQWGEDGIMEEIFRRIGEGTKTCCEFGAWDGKHMSNTWHLWHDKNWSAVLIEGDRARFLDLQTSTREYLKIIPYHAFVEKSGDNSLDLIFRKINTKDIDLLSIDIDGDDYYIFESLMAKPRVVIVEFNPTIPAHLSIISAPREYFGSSAKAITELGKKKGYTLAAITETNCIFVINDEFPKLNIEAVDLYKDFPTKHITYLVSSYDGMAFATQTPPYSKVKKENRNRTIGFVGKNPLVPLSLQVRGVKKILPAFKRRLEKIPGLKSSYKKILITKDIFQWKRKGRPVPAPHRIKEDIVLEYGKRFGAKTLVETGTYMGEMVQAARKNFYSIISIELDHTLAENANKMFSKDRHVKILQGDSSVLLPAIVKELIKTPNEKTLFWLDAHYSGGITAKGLQYTPILSEAEIISHLPQENTIILVDDARLFTGIDEYPLLSDFKHYISKKFPHHFFEVEDDVIRITPTL